MRGHADLSGHLSVVAHADRPVKPLTRPRQDDGCAVVRDLPLPQGERDQPALNRNSVRDRKVSPGRSTVDGNCGRLGLF